jgi:hypothetical protein
VRVACVALGVVAIATGGATKLRPAVGAAFARRRWSALNVGGADGGADGKHLRSAELFAALSDEILIFPLAILVRDRYEAAAVGNKSKHSL